MSSCIQRGWLAAAWLLAAAGTQAQPAPTTGSAGSPNRVGMGGAADPLQAGAAVPPMVYSAPLARYRVAKDVEVGSWAEANDTVTRIGGWRAYAREASQPEAPAPATEPATAPGTAPGAAPGHGKH